MGRVFFITDMKCKLGGGGGGVNYRLMMANEKYRLFDEAIFIFADIIILTPGENRINVPWDPAAQVHQDDFSMLDAIFDFTEDDLFVFHSLELFFIYKLAAPSIQKSIMVYHGQGGIYYERLSFGETPDAENEETYDTITKFALLMSSFFAFPSKVAMKAFIDTQPGIEDFIDKSKCKILYNGCSPVSPEEYDDNSGIIDRINNFKGKIFVSVANLVEQKGVERLPKFFKELGEYLEDYKWIIIGNGIKHNELVQAISDNHIEDHVIWEKSYVDNRLVIKIYELADFYILAHRFSIFDFATIEAMHMECIPVLSEVGGNLEMIENGSGYFLDEALSGKQFYQWMTEQQLEELKKKNQDIAAEKFSERAMINGYYELCSKVDG